MTALKKIGASILAVSTLGGAYMFAAQPPTLNSVASIKNAEDSYFTKHGKYLQIKQGNLLPSYESGAVVDKLNANIAPSYFVNTYETPDGTRGYKVFQHIPPPPSNFISSTSTISSSFKGLLQNLLAWAIPTAYAFTSNTHSTNLDQASTQFWSRADNVALSITGSISASFWVNFNTIPSALGGGTNETFATKYQSTTNNASYEFWVQGNDRISLRIVQDGVHANRAEWLEDAATIASAGVWYHIVITWNASTNVVTMYVNNTSKANTQTVSGTPTAIFDGNADFAIGVVNAGTGGVEPLDGKIDEFLLYSGVLSSTDVNTLYTDPCNPPTTNLVDEWHFDNDGTGVNGNDLTNNNSATFTTTHAFDCAAAAGGGAADDTYFEVLE